MTLNLKKNPNVVNEQFYLWSNFITLFSCFENYFAFKFTCPLQFEHYNIA
jgi:hypothetical protein